MTRHASYCFLGTDNFRNFIACSRFSDSGEDVKVKAREKLLSPPVLFSSSRFLHSAGPIISEPGTGQELHGPRVYTFVRVASYSPLTFSDGKIFFFLLWLPRSVTYHEHMSIQH